MDITVEATSPEKVRTGALVLGVVADGPLASAARAVDGAANGKLSAIIARGDLEGTAGASLLLHDVAGTAAERILLVSLGKRDALGDRSFRDAVASAARMVGGSAATDAVMALGTFDVPGRSLAWRAEQASRI